MNKNIFWISRRLRLTGATGENTSTGALIAVIGVALAVMVMEMTLCIVSGFKAEIQNKIVGFDAQITIGRPYDYVTGEQEEFITKTKELDNILLNTGNNQLASLSISLPAMLKTEDNFSGVIFIGHDKFHKTDFEEGNMIDGVFPDYESVESENEIVISRSIANELNLSLKDKCFVYFFADSALKSRKVEIAGIYESNLTEYDKAIVYSSMSFLQKVMAVDSITGTHFEIAGYRIDDIADKALILQNTLMDNVQKGMIDKLYPVTTVLQSGAIYFNWLALLDTNVIVIFILMTAVAIFTLVSSLFLIVLDRIPTIGVMKSLGADNSFVSGVFLNLGFRLAIRGLVIGNVLGLGLCLLQHITGVVSLDPQMYYLTKVPVKIEIIPLIVLNISIMIISLMILYLPAKSASKIDPTKSMRYE